MKPAPHLLACLSLSLAALGCDQEASAPAVCDVQPAFAAAGCTSCHGALSPAAGLDLTLDADALGAKLLDAPSTACVGRRLVDSRDPEASVLLSSVDHARRELPGACALAMPLRAGADAFAPAELGCLEDWVKSLTEGKGGAEFEAVSLPTAVAKLKMLVHGGAVTDAELAAVTDQPSSLRDLVDGWTRTPEYTVKLRSFLGTALQQDAVGELRETLGFPALRFTPSALLRATVSRSFVDTAVDLIGSGAPFTEVVTTHRRSVSTAELVLVAYSDQTSTEIDGTTYKVRLVGPPRQNNVAATVTKVGDVWELGGALATGQTCRFRPPVNVPIPDVQTMSSPQFLSLLFGRVQCRGTPDLRYPAPVTTADHADPRAITFDRAAGPRVTFTDLAGLRALGADAKLRLRAPRPGFFGTSVFLDNWPTNQDNAFRVTLNQALLVGLGASFSMGDATPGAATGVDEVHADPDSTCYRCHRLMDPMRPLLANDMDPAYRSVTTAPVPGTFAFLGSSRAGSSADDLALAIIEHPRFATAWVLRICSWANSRSCSDAEPGVTELAASFRASNWDFRTLMVDTLSSPLVTGLSGTVLSVNPEPSISRRRHLCAALRARLGRVIDTSGVCSAAADALARAVPDDGFARNQPDFIQTSTPGMFHAAAVERLCATLAPAVVTARFPSNDVAGSVKQVVELLMGLPPRHPRHDAAITALTAHVAAVAAAGGSADQAMQSVFVTACTSPDVSGVGL